MYQSTYQLYHLIYWLSLSRVSVENRSIYWWRVSRYVAVAVGPHVLWVNSQLILRQQITDTWLALWSVTSVQTLNVSAIISFSLLGTKEKFSHCQGITGLLLTLQGSCWWMKTKAFLSVLWKLNYFFLKILPKISYCLQSTNMATLSRSCKLRTMYIHVHVQCLKS